jgi:hypothetical protein
VAGPRLGEAAEAAGARARPEVTLRPFAPFSGANEADEGGGDWSFIDCEMEEVDLQDLPSATIACHLDPRVFVDGLCRVRAGRGGPSGRWADTCCREAAARVLASGRGQGGAATPRGHGPLLSSWGGWGRRSRAPAPSTCWTCTQRSPLSRAPKCFLRRPCAPGGWLSRRGMTKCWTFRE